MSFRMSAYIPLQGIGVKRRRRPMAHDTRRRRKALRCSGHDHAGHDHARTSRRTRRRTAHRSGLRHDGRSAHRQASPRPSRRSTYYFCSAGCRTKFAADPAKYLAHESASRSAACRKARSTPARCIRRSARSAPAPARSAAWRSSPRSSPPTTRPNPELADMTRRFWIGLALAAAGRSCWRWAAHLVGGHGLIDQTLSNWIQLVLATPVVLWAGWPFFVRGWQSMRDAQSQHVHADRAGHRRRLCSTASSRPSRPDCFPPAFRGHDGAVAVYFEAAAVITVLVLLGQVLELRAREQTSGAIRALLDLAPKTARRIDADGSDEDVPLDAGRGRRPAARAARREGAGRRRRGRRPLRASTNRW